MAPSAVEGKASAAPPAKSYPPAKIFPVIETRFEKHIPPSNDGRKKALEQFDGSAAIVIDNGESPSSR